MSVGAAAGSAAVEFVTVNRVVFPLEKDRDVDALYFRGAKARPVGRHSLRVESGGSASLATYFNAFPAGYWRQHTGVDRVRVEARFDGSGRVTLQVASAEGSVEVAAARDFDDDNVVFDLPIHSFDDGGCAWLVVDAGDQPATLVAAEWQVKRPPGWGAGTVTIGITTFNRPTYCLDQVRAIADSEDVRALLDGLIIVDQGHDLVSAQPGFDHVAESLADSFTLVRQTNLGGSGGFARAMLQALEDGRSRYVLLLDDDAICEPEAIVRAVRFADFARRPIIVGGGMLHLDDRTRLYAQGERWSQRLSWVTHPSGVPYEQDLATSVVGSDLYRMSHIDFNGWWMALIPSDVIRRVGMPLPLFVKFDDVEFGLRAGAQGIPTVSLPGVAVWHLAWGAKDTPRSWESYYILRNRVVTGLLHSGRRFGGLLPLHSFAGDLRLLLRLQYSTVRIRHEAMRDALSEPGLLRDWLATRREHVLELRHRFSDAIAVPRRGASGALVYSGTRRPHTKVSSALRLLRVLIRHLFFPVKSPADAPVPVVTAEGLDWWTFSNVDRADVLSVDGQNVYRHRRELRLTWRMLGASIALNLRLALRWRRAAARFQSRLTSFTSVESWTGMFADTGRLDSNP